jgi:pyruvate decarboxylase
VRAGHKATISTRGLTAGEHYTISIEKALAQRAGPTLIECTIDRDDCTKQLLEGGSRVAVANARQQQRA